MFTSSRPRIMCKSASRSVRGRLHSSVGPTYTIEIPDHNAFAGERSRRIGESCEVGNNIFQADDPRFLLKCVIVEACMDVNPLAVRVMVLVITRQRFINVDQDEGLCHECTIAGPRVKKNAGDLSCVTRAVGTFEDDEGVADSLAAS